MSSLAVHNRHCIAEEVVYGRSVGLSFEEAQPEKKQEDEKRMSAFYFPTKEILHTYTNVSMNFSSPESKKVLKYFLSNFFFLSFFSTLSWECWCWCASMKPRGGEG